MKLKIWSSSRSVLGQSCFRLKYFQAEVLLGPKHSSGQSGIGAKLGESRDNLAVLVEIGLSKEVLKLKTSVG